MSEYKKTKIFNTLLGDFKLIDKNNNEIELEVMEDDKEPLQVYLDNNSNNIIEYDKYKSFIIRFDLTKMNINEEYQFKFSKKWKYNDSDERVFTYSYQESDKVIAFTFQDTNELADFYHEEKYNYDVYYDNKNNIFLEVIDYKKKYGYCCITWAWDIKDHLDDYDDACVVDSWKVFDM